MWLKSLEILEPSSLFERVKLRFKLGSATLNVFISLSYRLSLAVVTVEKASAVIQVLQEQIKR